MCQLKGTGLSGFYHIDDREANLYGRFDCAVFLRLLICVFKY
jgi:hypothetical protein